MRKFLSVLCLTTICLSVKAQASQFFNLRRRLGTACEQRVKTALRENKPSFAETDADEIDQAVKAANSRLTTVLPRTLLLSETKMHDVVKVSAVSHLGDEGLEQFVEDLSLSQDTPKWPLALQKTVTIKNAAGDLTVLTQTANYDGHCRENVVETIVQHLTLAGSNLHVREIELNPAEEKAQVSENTADLPVGARLLPMMPRTYDGKSLRELYAALLHARTFVFGSRPVPLIELVTKSRPLVVRYNPLTSAYEQLNSVEVESLIDGQVATTNVFNFSKTNSYGEDIDASGVREFTVTEKIWRTRLLGGAVDNLSNVSFDDSDFKDGQTTPLTAKLIANEELDYDNINAYWKILSHEKVDAGKNETQYAYTLEAQRKPLTRDSLALTEPSDRNAPFLRPTEYVQPNLPQIQAAVKKLKKNFTGTRVQMAQKILKLIPKLIDFDDEMVDDNEVVALKTEQILARGKGVCQHYANLFAALARAAGIPTRIISGFTFDAKTLFGHAWNEIEVENNMWLPIEPQYEKVYVGDYWQYVPLSVSAELDDPTRKGDLIHEDWLMANLVFSLEKIENANSKVAGF